MARLDVQLQGKWYRMFACSSLAESCHSFWGFPNMERAPQATDFKLEKVRAFISECSTIPQRHLNLIDFLFHDKPGL